MRKRIALTVLLACLLMFSSTMLCFASGSATLYAHSESVSIGATHYKALKTTACDGPQSYLRYQGADNGVVTLGNQSVIQMGNINSRIKSFDNTTWTFTYYTIANVSNKVRLLVSIYIVDSTGTTIEEHAFKASTSLLSTTSNATKTGTYAFATSTTIESTDYLKIYWYINKTDTTKLTVTLWLDVAATPTKIEGLEYEVHPDSYYWNSAVRGIWQILLPIIFVIGAAIPFVSYKKGQLSLYDAIILSVALLFLAVMVPAAMNVLYSA